MKFTIYFVLLLSLLLIGCNKAQNVPKRADVDELNQFFYQHQAQFNELASAACAYITTTSLGFNRLRRNAAVTYPEHLAPYAAKMNTLLNLISVDEMILHQATDDDCSLFIRKWAVWHSDGGSHLGYSYQPPKLSEYNPAIHHKDNRNTNERLHFTKPLTDGWYIEYVNLP
ncbi:hypothetical protein [Arsukibacterium sp.]|uniref:hypothetical protein n=1 Tax=Arsukibacterium sp. TaxID=1977258 RepID=UPI001BD34381|nr:hypothetical protein [Arsukibacterium sp.]